MSTRFQIAAIVFIMVQAVAFGAVLLTVLATPLAPAFSGDAVTITNVTGVVYKDGAGTTINAAGSPYAVDPQETFIVNATPATGYYFATSDDDHWDSYPYFGKSRTRQKKAAKQ